MHPSSSKAFQRHQEHDLKQHPGSVDLKTKQKTKQTTLPKTSRTRSEAASRFGGSENKTKNKTNYLPFIDKIGVCHLFVFTHTKLESVFGVE